jgi:hypothetical protein
MDAAGVSFRESSDARRSYPAFTSSVIFGRANRSTVCDQIAEAKLYQFRLSVAGVSDLGGFRQHPDAILMKVAEEMASVGDMPNWWRIKAHQPCGGRVCRYRIIGRHDLPEPGPAALCRTPRRPGSGLSLRHRSQFLMISRRNASMGATCQTMYPNASERCVRFISDLLSSSKPSEVCFQLTSRKSRISSLHLGCT